MGCMVEMGHKYTGFPIETLGPSHDTSTFISFNNLIGWPGWVENETEDKKDPGWAEDRKEGKLPSRLSRAQLQSPQPHLKCAPVFNAIVHVGRSPDSATKSCNHSRPVKIQTSLKA